MELSIDSCLLHLFSNIGSCDVMPKDSFSMVGKREVKVMSRRVEVLAVSHLEILVVKYLVHGF